LLGFLAAHMDGMIKLENIYFDFSIQESEYEKR
jgi:hypothetical protein